MCARNITYDYIVVINFTYNKNDDINTTINYLLLSIPSTILLLVTITIYFYYVLLV